MIDTNKANYILTKAMIQKSTITKRNRGYGYFIACPVNNGYYDCIFYEKSTCKVNDYNKYLDQDDSVLEKIKQQSPELFI